MRHGSNYPNARLSRDARNIDAVDAILNDKATS